MARSISTPSGDSFSISTPRRGRPRIHANDSAKTAAYRSRLRKRCVAGEISPKIKHHRHCIKEKHNLDGCLCGQTLSKGLFLTGAPLGCGKILSGDYDSDKINLVGDFQGEKDFIIDPSGRRVAVKSGRVVPKGHSIKLENKKWKEGETESTFMDKQNFSGNEKQTASPAVVIGKPTCWCGDRASTIHPDDRSKRLPVRFMCEKHGSAA